MLEPDAFQISGGGGAEEARVGGETWKSSAWRGLKKEKKKVTVLKICRTAEEGRKEELIFKVNLMVYWKV